MSKICFIVGHGKSKTGGYDSGATSGNYHEFKIAKEIAKYAQEYYNKNYDEHCDLMNYDGSLYLQDRINKCKDNTYDFIAEFHLNAGGGTGTECYYHHGSEKGRKYADQICKDIAAALGVKQRANGTDDGGDKIKLGKNGDYFGIIRDTKPTAVLIETVFIDTKTDLDKVKTAAGQKKCGEAIAKAVAKVRGVKNKVEKPVPTPAPTPAKPATNKDYLYKVKVTCKSLNIRKGAGDRYAVVGTVKKNDVFRITEAKGNWGKLYSGAGWIYLPYTKKI